MITLKDVSDSLIKMTDFRLNLAIFITCVFLVIISPGEKFILDPFPKVIVQSLTFITLTRVVHGIIFFAHNQISHYTNKRRIEQENIKNEIDKKLAETAQIQTSHYNLKKLDVFQLKIIRELITSNTLSVQKGAVLFSLKQLGLVYSVSDGPKTQGISLTNSAISALEMHYGNNLTQLEQDAIRKCFTHLSANELKYFEDMIEKGMVKTYYTSNRRLQRTVQYETFEKYRNSILFEQPVRDYQFKLSENTHDILIELKSSAKDV